MQTASPDISKQSTIYKASGNALLMQNYASDPKFKKYTQQVEKCLSSFDNVQEWADFISFLKQLLKTFQSYMQFKEIPRKLIVSKRLAQCLNPALPTGVHQRALDVYTHILSVLGSEGLQRDLPLWSAGLFPFFQYAATSVKPSLLNLYDTHFLPLQQGLRPIMKSFIIALLPGLEEETGEYFEKVLGLLDRLSGTVSPSFFLQNVWLIMLTSPPNRGTALNYLARRLPRIAPEEDVTHIVGRDVGLMIRAFAAVLEDDNSLVRRAALDLLLTSLRLDSLAVKNARAEDRTILMRAACSVVLRRDLALNRRLYTWLLGPEEGSENQSLYLRQNALDLLKSTLEEEMDNPSSEYSESRPFKIFVSLLDKWEVGGPLTEVLVYNALRAIEKHVEVETEGSEDVKMTASTLYEAVEPQVVWKQLLRSIISEITGETPRTEAIHMTKFLLGTFHVQDEEVQTIHLPIVFSAISEAIRACLGGDNLHAASDSVREALVLQEEILRHIPATALKLRPQSQDKSKTQGPLDFACSFYGIENPFGDDPVQRACVDRPFVTNFEDLIVFTATAATSLMSCTPQLVQPLRAAFCQSVLLVMRLLGRIDQRLDTPFDVDWDPPEWLSIALESVEHPGSTFTMVDRVISLAVSLHHSQSIQPKLSIDNRPTISKMIAMLLRYLRPEYAVYHVRAVNLVWQLENANPQPHVEAVLSQSLASPQSRNNQGVYEAFGVLWRLTDDNLLPGFRFKIPMMITLDTLKSDDTVIRRIGETWMRCSLKSYLRVLDPILFDLLDPSVRRSRSLTRINGKELQDFTYDAPTDQRLINYLLDTLLSVVRFGGQGFVKVANSTPIRRSSHPGLVKRVESFGLAPGDGTYLDAVLDILIQFLQSEPNDPGLAAMCKPNVITQSLSVDLLQTIIARGEIDQTALETVEAVIVTKLYMCVHTGRLDLQNKLLHLLHSIISALTTLGSHLPMTHQPRMELISETTQAPDVDREGAPQSYNMNPLFTQTLMDGIGTLSNRPLLQHWLDFVLMTIPQFHLVLQPAVEPLIECICRQLRSATNETASARAQSTDTQDVFSATSDTELIMLLHAIERLLLLNLSRQIEAADAEDDSSYAEKPTTDGAGLFGYVSNVFGSEHPAYVPEEQLAARSSAYRSLHRGVSVLYNMWIALEWRTPQPWTSKDDSLSYIYNRTRARCRRVLEHLFRERSTEVLESIIDCWSGESSKSESDSTSVFELVDALTSSAQAVVHMLCESIYLRLSTTPDKHKKPISNTTLTDVVLFRFLEKYVSQLEGPVANQVWNRFMQLVKEVVTGLKDLKLQGYYTLRSLTVLADKVVQTTALDDRRLRKELQENYGKLVDSCVVSVSRLDAGTWIRRTTKDTLSAVNGRDSPIPRVASDSKLEETFSVNPWDSKPHSETEAGEQQVTQYIAQHVVPNMRRFLMENDKVLASCINMVYYIVTPSLRGKARTLDLDVAVLALLEEMSKLSIALKAWRSPVSDALNDGRFFNSLSTAGRRWRLIVRALVATDKSAFAEILGKITTAPSTNIFSNREQEMLLRALSLRRLSFVLYTGDKNQFLTQLPSVQEKLVDTLRNVSTPIVQSEVYLCVRVLLCRLSAHNLTSFWPVILTEMYRLFEQTILHVPVDGSDELPLILSACKFLDLLLVLQTEEFQVHQWVFVTDTVDAVYRPDNWAPEAMMDRLAEVATSAPTVETKASSTPVEVQPISTFVDTSHPARRPMLDAVRNIESIRDLAPFFSSVSITSYESVYASGGVVDWMAVEQGLLDDMFETR
ncbi:Dopey, N-terminal-domain-containing protein [Thelephora terrestris]|uniref:Dopey, N-terminal-domain-containing protein n=1 Tax=Thelephora terrestris TaxID=56493 RepID=A0A9P6HH60_9AGAM|nr:Dopey, N-terminal-domain-containing protein [Thelephora terrestris]